MKPEQTLLWGDRPAQEPVAPPKAARPLLEVAHSLVGTALETAREAARAYHAHHGLEPHHAALETTVREQVAEALPDALEDAWDAFEAGQRETAAAAFVTRFRLVGIRAARMSRT